MPWPAIPDFSAAIQNPSVCFEDSELASGQVGENQRGMPLVWSGSFAAVYHLLSGGREFAVRCFTNEVKDQQERYAQLSEYLLTKARPDAFVRFEYLAQGIRVRGEWYPVVKMNWVSGARLDKFVENNLSHPGILREMCARWRGANGSLRGLGIAHNDLQHGNVMVQDDEALRLVDYDGIFLPQFRGENSPELGHRNFQHPLRTPKHYDEQVDNFPSLVVYLSLLALSSDPNLWTDFYNQENLILTKADFADPSLSECFKALKNSPDDTVRRLAEQLEELCSFPVDQVPDLESILGDYSAVAKTPQANYGLTAQASTVSPPAASAAPTVANSSSSEYRNLIQTGQISPPATFVAPATPASAPAAAATIAGISQQAVVCRKCSRSNPSELVYCDDESCYAELHPGYRSCANCRQAVPVKGNYCPECGSALA